VEGQDGNERKVTVLLVVLNLWNFTTRDTTITTTRYWNSSENDDLRRPRRSIKMNFKKTDCEDERWMKLAQDCDHWQSLVYFVWLKFVTNKTLEVQSKWQVKGPDWYLCYVCSTTAEICRPLWRQILEVCWEDRCDMCCFDKDNQRDQKGKKNSLFKSRMFIQTSKKCTRVGKLLLH
jgi:hypothetical protein